MNYSKQKQEVLEAIMFELLACFKFISENILEIDNFKKLQKITSKDDKKAENLLALLTLFANNIYDRVEKMEGLQKIN
ncbi:MAG: hypothetical protein N2202_03970 [Proteobacteria bacterium]|nr:hypothetical protein [Pseudomonadota bacterium]